VTLGVCLVVMWRSFALIPHAAEVVPDEATGVPVEVQLPRPA